MPWNDKLECMPVEALKDFQLKKLKETVAWVSEKVPFYKNKFKEMGVSAEDIKSLEDIAKLPFTVKSTGLGGGFKAKIKGFDIGIDKSLFGRGPNRFFNIIGRHRHQSGLNQ